MPADASRLCPLCRSRESRFFLEKNDCRLFTCMTCGLVFIDPVPTTTSHLYVADYFSGAEKGFGYPDYELEKKDMTPTFEKYLDLMEKVSPGKTLLDVGAANGFFMARARERDWEVQGIEISEYARSEAKKKGLSVFSSFEDISDRHDTFDVISFLDSIEHVPHPRQDLEKAIALLREGGVLVLNTPDAGSLFARMMGPRWHLIVPPEHLFLFNRKNMTLLLRELGVEPFYIGTIGKRFSIRYISSIISNHYPHSRMFKWLAHFLSTHQIGSIALPLNFRHNMFLMARK